MTNRMKTLILGTMALFLAAGVGYSSKKISKESISKLPSRVMGATISGVLGGDLFYFNTSPNTVWGGVSSEYGFVPVHVRGWVAPKFDSEDLTEVAMAYVSARIADAYLLGKQVDLLDITYDNALNRIDAVVILNGREYGGTALSDVGASYLWPILVTDRPKGTKWATKIGPIDPAIGDRIRDGNISLANMLGLLRPRAAK